LSLLRPRKKSLATALVIVIAATLGGGFYLWRVPIDMEQYKGRVIAECEDITGADLTTGKTTLRLLPSPYLEVRDVHMTVPEGEVLKAGIMKLHISVLPIFLKKIVITQMSIEGWDLHIQREKDGSMALRRIYERVIKRKHIVSVKTMALEAGRLFINDKMEGRELSVLAALNLGRLELKGGALNFQADLGLEDGTALYTSGSVEKRDGKIALRGRATIEDLDLARVSAYVKRPAIQGRLSGDVAFNYGKALVVSGPVNYKKAVINEPALAPEPIHSPSGEASIYLRLDENVLDLKVKKAHLAIDNFILSGSMDMAGQRGRSDGLAINLDIQSTAIPVKEVKALVLDRVFNKGKLAWINDLTPLGGGVSVKSLTLKTTVKELREGTAFARPGAVRLEAGLDKLRFRHRILGIEEIDNLNGWLTFTGDSIDFHGLSAAIGTGFIKKLSYRMDNLYSSHKPTSYELSLLGHMDAGRAIALTIRVFRDSGESVKKQLRRISATGDTRIKFGIKGKIDVKDSTWFSVNLGLKGATFRYNDFPLSFTSMDGNIDIDNKRFTFTDLYLRDGANSLIKVEGYARDYTGATPRFNLKTTGSLYGGTLSALASGSALEGLVLDDALSFNASMTGPENALKVVSNLDLGSTGMAYKKVIKKESSIPLAVASELLLKDGVVEIKKAAISTSATTLNVKGNFATGAKTSGLYSLFIDTKKARLYDVADLTPLITKGADTAGTLNVIMKVSRGRGKKSPEYSGLISIEKGSFATPLTQKAFKALDLFIDLNGDRASLRCPELRLGGSDVHGSIDMTSVSKKVLRFNLTSTRLDTSDIWGDEASGLTRWIDRLRSLGVTGQHEEKDSARLVTGSGKISVNTGRVLGEEINDLKGVVQLGQKTINIDPLVFVTKGGTVRGKTLFYRDEKSPRLFKGSAGLSGLHLKEILAGLGAKKDLLTGTLYGNVDINCSRGAKPFSRCLNGKAYLKAERGRMWKFRVISKIFSVVNIISIDELFKKGLPYRTLAGNFIVKRGVISTDNLLFSSDSMRMSAVMDIDSADGTIDATMGIHPFVTIDKVVTTIPLVGWIIGGEEKSSVSLYYTIKGPLKKPEVKPAPIKNIQKGIFGKIERLITSPIKIIKESSKMIKHQNNKGKSHE